MKSTFAFLPFVLVTFAFGGSAGEPEASSATVAENKQTIEQLILQLGSKDFNVRDQATRKLKEMEEALPALQVAAQSDDLETRQRAEQIILVLKGRPLQKLVVDGNIQVIDQFIDQLWADKELLNDDHWAAALKLAQELHAWGKKQIAGKYALLKPDFELLAKRPVMVKEHDKRDLNDRPVDPARLLTTKVDYANTISPHHCLIISRGPVDFAGTAAGMVILANGNVDVDQGGRDGSLWRCIVVCEGTIVVDSAPNCVLIATGKIRVRDQRNCVLIENAKNPLPVGKFFEPAMAGIEVSAAGEEVRVEKLHEGKRFAKAGVRKGDQLVALGDAKVTSADVFRRLLRRAVVERGERVLKIERAGKTIEVKVLF